MTERVEVLEKIAKKQYKVRYSDMDEGLEEVTVFTEEEMKRMRKDSDVKVVE